MHMCVLFCLYFVQSCVLDVLAAGGSHCTDLWIRMFRFVHIVFCLWCVQMRVLDALLAGHIAVWMGQHRNLGAGSPLHLLDEFVIGMILDHAFGANVLSTSPRWIRHRYHTEWRRPITCLFSVGHFPSKSPIINGSCGERDLQLKTSYASSWPPCTGSWVLRQDLLCSGSTNFSLSWYLIMHSKCTRNTNIRIHMCEDYFAHATLWMLHTHTHTHTHICISSSATHCNTLHHTASHCTTLHHTAPHYITLQYTARLLLAPREATRHVTYIRHLL